MQRYVVRRLLLAIPTIWLVITLVFFMSHGRPSRAEQLAATCSLSKTVCARNTANIKHQLGEDKPLWQQYAVYLGGVVHGDFGHSLVPPLNPALTELKNRAGPSIELGIWQIILSAIFAIPIGIIAAVKQDSWIDYMLRFLSIGLLAVPSFFLGPVMLIAGEKWFGWTPNLNPGTYKGLFEAPWQNVQVMLVPALAGAFATSAAVMRLLRSQMLEVIRQDFVRTARAKGLRASVVIMRHTLKNAMIPVLTILGLLTAGLIGGNVVLEVIFGIPGIGAFLVESVQLNDLPIILAISICIALIVVVTNLVVDLTYAWFDPRIRYS